MTCKMLLKEGSVRTGVLQHIFMYFVLLEKRRSGGGDKSIHFWNGLFNGSPNIPESGPCEL